MASNHVSPYVQDGIAGFRVVYRLILPNNYRTKSNSVSTARFPICDGVTEQEAWDAAQHAAAVLYNEAGHTVPLPKFDWKAMGQTRTKTEKYLYQEKTNRAQELYKAGYSTRRIADEVGVSVASVNRWKKFWR